MKRDRLFLGFSEYLTENAQPNQIYYVIPHAYFVDVSYGGELQCSLYLKLSDKECGEKYSGARNDFTVGKWEV